MRRFLPVFRVALRRLWSLSFEMLCKCVFHSILRALWFGNASPTCSFHPALCTLWLRSPGVFSLCSARAVIGKYCSKARLPRVLSQIPQQCLAECSLRVKRALTPECLDSIFPKSVCQACLDREFPKSISQDCQCVHNVRAFSLCSGVRRSYQVDFLKKASNLWEHDEQSMKNCLCSCQGLFPWL